jgi:hypothetical protein
VLWLVVMWGGIGVIVAWAVWDFVRNPGAFTWRQLLGGVPFLAIWPVVHWYMKPRKGRPILSALATRLAAHRRCGACGYDLRRTEPEGDGCVVCPECGGAWHMDRFVLEDQDPRESAVLAKLMAQGHMTPREEMSDDRGEALDRAIKWPPVWLNAETTPRAEAEELRRVGRRKLGRFYRFAGPAALVVWGGLAVLFLSRATERETDLIVMTCVATGVITGIALYAAARIYMDREMRRKADLLGLCNNCGRLLPDVAPAFDGCVVCGGCKRAWRIGGEEAAGAMPEGRTPRP